MIPSRSAMLLHHRRVLTIAVACVGMLALAACGTTVAANHPTTSPPTTATPVTAPPTTTSPGIPGSGGMTLAQLTSSAQSQISGKAPSGFAVTGVHSVVCNPPSTWAAAKTFTCYAYASDGSEVGEYDGTVLPNDSSGDQQWNAVWEPNADYTAPTTAPPTTSPALAVVRTEETVVFNVTGNAATGADITYGTDTINDSPPGNLGFEGDGTALPWQASLPYNAQAEYWYLDAQIDSTGSISCSVVLEIEHWYANGTTHTTSTSLASGQASGEYNECDAES